jgi:hypothetical protein
MAAACTNPAPMAAAPTATARVPRLDATSDTATGRRGPVPVVEGSVMVTS